MQTTTTTTTTPAPKPDAQPVQAAIPPRPKLGAPASEWADYNAAISAAGIRFQDKLNAEYVAKAQPVTAALPYWRDGRVTDPEKYAAWIAKRADDARAALQMARGAK